MGELPPKEECFSVGRAIDCRGIHEINWSLVRFRLLGLAFFFAPGGVHVPGFALRQKRGPTERTGTQNGICDFTGDLVFCTQARIAMGPGNTWRRVLGECGLRDETVHKSRPRGGRWLGGLALKQSKKKYSIKAHDELVETRTKLR